VIIKEIIQQKENMLTQKHKVLVGSALFFLIVTYKLVFWI
jgi:hypothetical protein